MPTETEPTSASSQKANEDDKSSQRAGLTHKLDRGRSREISRRVSWPLPLSPFEMFRITPFSLFRRMADEFDRAIQPSRPEGEANRPSPGSPPLKSPSTMASSTSLPNFRIVTNEVRAEAEEGAVVIQGERKVEHESTEGGVRRSQRQFGFFYRRIPLPEGADPEQAKARFHDGVLEISMPAPKPQSNRRQIQIESDNKSPSTETKPAANDAKQAA